MGFSKNLQPFFNMQQLRKEQVMICCFFVVFFFFNFKSSYLSFGLKFRYILMNQVLPGMQNKLSKSRDLALEPMG